MPETINTISPSKPQPGQSQWIAEGVKWVRLPMPFKPDHVNVYLIRDHDGWALVDTGLYGDQTQNYWQQVFTDELDGLPITTVIVTHMHPDHAGQAGWIARLFKAPLWMSQAEYLHARLFNESLSGQAPAEALRFFQSAGVDSQTLEQIKASLCSQDWLIEPLPSCYRRLSHQDWIKIGEHRWQVLAGTGHSPEHVCLFSPDQQLLISGDQVLPDIHPNVSVTYMEPDAEPLGSWIKALQQLLTLPESTQVLPSHGAPFTGLRSRIESQLEHQQRQLQRLQQSCTKPQTINQLVSSLYRDNLQTSERILAIGECLARLNYLLACGLISRTVGNDQINRYQSQTPQQQQHHQEKPALRLVY